MTLSLRLRLLCGIVLLVLSMAMAFAADTTKPFLHPLFASGMVWQRNVAAPIWGWSTPGAKVSVSMNGKSAQAIADADGKWLAKLGPFQAGGPFTLTVTGLETVTLTDVLIGDVWVCSGQSNMEFGVGLANNAKQEIASATDSNIRLFYVPHNSQLAPQSTVKGLWEVCSPDTVAHFGWGGFSACAYFFGRQLRQDVKVPIGLIETCWGGTVAQTWVSNSALRASLPAFIPQLDQIDTYAANPHYAEQFDTILADWWRAIDGIPAGSTISPYTQADFDAAAWKTMKLPIHVRDTDEKINGIFWFRKEVQIPDGWAGKDLQLHLSGIDDSDVSYFNGQKVGTTTGYANARAYPVPGAVVKAGRAIIAVRLTTDTWGWGGICGVADEMKLINPADAANPIALAGDWKYLVVDDFAKKTVPSRIDADPNHPTLLYNGMIAPLLPFAIKGAIWYQGESNVGSAMQYRTLLSTLITDWRTRFGVGDFPFYIVSLANLGDVDAQPKDSGWAELREAQYYASVHVPNCGLAITLDIGDPKDIHPKNKQEVGRRLALNAEALSYGLQLEYSGPVYKKMTVQDKNVRLDFDHLGGGLVAKGDKLKGFAIAGTDKHFVWADAVIEGNTIIVSSPDVALPVAVRYNWDDNPVGNLFNKVDLPAVPFRTDMP